MTIAGQRLGKHIREVTQSTVEGPALLGSKSLGTFLSNGQKIDNNRRTVRGGGISLVRSGFIRKRIQENSITSESSFGIRHS
jgi:hypothetical protein